jgi:hypothetical protein
MTDLKTVHRRDDGRDPALGAVLAVSSRPFPFTVSGFLVFAPGAVPDLTHPLK